MRAELALGEQMLKSEHVVISKIPAVLACVVWVACQKPEALPEPEEPPAAPEPAPMEEAVEPEPELTRPVPLWEAGDHARDIDGATAADDGHLLLDLGEAWTPYIFSERDPATGERQANAYRTTYLSLARGEFPDDHHGDRARRDKYLELYGIMPTLALMRTRFKAMDAKDCAHELDPQIFRDFEGTIVYRDQDRAKAQTRRFNAIERHVQRMVEDQGVASHAELNADALSRRDQSRLREYNRDREQVHVLRAAQARLECEGYFDRPGSVFRGAMDWPTHEALAEFERRYRVYAWGVIGNKTLEVLRMSSLEAERESVIRVLTERAMHAAGVIEDGSRSTLASGEPRTYRGADGSMHPIPNFEAELREKLIAAFGLQTPESTLEWLDSLGELPANQSQWVAIENVERPEYYSDNMDLRVVIDRGDVWYEFPYDEEGRERRQPVARRPTTTITVHHNGQTIPLARFGTTIGGWRSDFVDGHVMWKYKGSEVGPRVWARIVASPVWMPPESTPPGSLLVRTRRGGRAINYHETGPSYASAYGLVAAYHQKFHVNREGELRLGGDEGIRSHGSVDYMSIMRRHSHGCHRLHNHIAVRLMSYVLQHRPHRRKGQQPLGYRREIEHDGESYTIELDQGGYVYELVDPLRVNVLEGRIRGNRRTPIETPLPKYDSDVGAYVMPDGSTVTVDRNGNITPITLEPDAGIAPPPLLARPDTAPTTEAPAPPEGNPAPNLSTQTTLTTTVAP